jgi:2-iminobutanoate/2-iminopropanoate deaminase
MKKEIKSAQAPLPVGPYSQAIQYGNFLFCSGQIPIDPKTNEVLKGSIQEQATLVMENIKGVLTEAGLSFDNVLKTTIFLTKMSDFATVNEVYSKYFKAPYPARSTVAVSELPKGVQVEVEVLVAKN